MEAMDKEKEWVYIIHRSGYIVELKLDEHAYKTTLEQWSKGDIIMVKSMNGKPLGINGTDVSNIATFDDYEAWIDSANPARYIKRGFWYTRDSRTQSYRTEPWRQKIIDETVKLKAAEESESELTPEQKKNIEKRKKEIRDMLSGFGRG